MPNKNARDRFILTAVISYIFFALAWIFLSDNLLAMWVDINAITYISTVKGVFFVLTTAALFFVLLKNVPSPDVATGVTFLDSMVSGSIKHQYPAWINYALAIALTISMLIFHQKFALGTDNEPKMILLIFPIILSALLGGFWPGLLSTFIAATGIILSFHPNFYSVFSSPSLLLRWAFLIINGLAISILSALLRKSIRRVQINQQLLESVASGTSDAIFVKDLQGRYLFINQAAAAFVHKTPSEILGCTDFELFDQDSAQDLVDKDRQIMQIGKVQTHEEHLNILGGESLFFLVTKGPTFDHSGQVNGLFGISRNITEQKKNQIILQENETALKLAQQLAGIGSWEWDLSTGQHRWSEQVYRIYNRDPQLPPLDYPEVQQYFSQSSWEALTAAIEQCLRDGQPYECTAELIRLDEKVRWISARGEAHRDCHGQITRLSGTVQDISVHKQLELQLQKSQQQLQLVIDATSDGFWDWDYRSGYIYRSNKYYEVIGLSADDDTHDLAFFLDHICPEDRPHARNTIETHLSGASHKIEFDCRVLMPNAEIRWLQARGQAVIRDESGKPVRIVGTLSDITDKKQAELALTQREQQLERVLEGSDQGYWDWNLQTDEFQVSARFETMLGYQPGELDVSTENWPNLVHPDDLKLAMISIDQHLAGQAPLHELEMRLKTKAGEWRWILSRGRVVDRDNNGQALMMSGTHTDITEHKLLELARSEAAIVFDGSDEGIMLVSPNKVITKVNTAFTRITGYSAQEILGQNPRILSSNQHDPQFYRELWASIEKNDFWRGEIWNRRKNGEVYPELLSISVMRDVVGQIQHYVGIFSDISMIKAHEAELDRVAHYDPLTGVPNRLLLADRLNQAILRSARSNTLCAVCFLDLDGFKAINDQYGHAVGDRLLITITERLQEILRAEDTIARLGGDEFVLIFSEINVTDKCTQILDRILFAINQPVLIDHISLQVTASIGLSLYPDDNVDPDTLLRHADQAMCFAKESGKNRYQLFDPEGDRKAQTHRQFMKVLQESLQDEQFVLYYQPKVDLSNDAVIGVEALIRWQHPEKGVLPPQEFLPDMHGNELEAVFGQWVIQSAIAQASEWHLSGMAFKVSVNICANHLLKPDFYEQLEQSFVPYPDLPKSFLELEILESAAIEDMTQAVEILNRCRDLGVKIALDDFGTGYSSLTYLRKLPIDALKIDQSFVRDMLIDADDLGIVESVIKLAAVFNLQVIAEGVETMEHGVLLRSLGCRYAQGYGVARPMPADQIQQWHTNWQTRAQ
ncbi:EAL domain-containing protein [Chitinibacter sp. S2-10]|uniref:EAL domain-containing protein n=1 Tax=Chitinibacter sp. S2-10 TaxID=3373597 RepID=UPI0039778AA2